MNNDANSILYGRIGKRGRFTRSDHKKVPHYVNLSPFYFENIAGWSGTPRWLFKEASLPSRWTAGSIFARNDQQVDRKLIDYLNRVAIGDSYLFQCQLTNNKDKIQGEPCLQLLLDNNKLDNTKHYFISENIFFTLIHAQEPEKWIVDLDYNLLLGFQNGEAIVAGKLS